MTKTILFQNDFVSDGERKQTRQKERRDHVGKKRRIAVADRKSVKVFSTGVRLTCAIYNAYTHNIRSHAITRAPTPALNRLCQPEGSGIYFPSWCLEVPLK